MDIVISQNTVCEREMPSLFRTHMQVNRTSPCSLLLYSRRAPDPDCFAAYSVYSAIWLSDIKSQSLWCRLGIFWKRVKIWSQDRPLQADLSALTLQSPFQQDTMLASRQSKVSTMSWMVEMCFASVLSLPELPSMDNRVNFCKSDAGTDGTDSLLQRPAAYALFCISLG